jgi:uncharacterized protein (DUF2062 family)
MAFFRDKFKSIFQVKDTPHRIAMAFAVGVFMGISPLLGLHYIGAFFIAWLFKLNKLVAMVGVSVNNPWTIVPISTFCVWLGAKLIGIKQVLPEVDWQNISLVSIIGRFSDLQNFIDLVKQLWPFLASFFVGSFLICTLSAVSGYFIIQILIKKYKKAEDAA